MSGHNKWSKIKHPSTIPSQAREATGREVVLLISVSKNKFYVRS